MSIKSKENNIKMILFAVIYSASCFITSKDIEGNIFYYNSLNFQLLKSTVIFILVFLVTIINRKNIEKINNYASIYTAAVGIIYFADNYTFHLSGSLTFFRLWWLSLIHIVFLAYYLGLFAMKEIDFNKLSVKALKGYSVLYAVSFIVVFLRPISNNLTTNIVPGQGTLAYINYLMKYPNDSEILFLVVGNIIFFLPISFMLQAYFPKIKPYQQIIIGLALPFIVEGYQFIFKCGDVDIDDIIMNFSGFFIGYLLLIIQNRIKKEKQGAD